METLRRAMFTFPGNQKIHISKKWVDCTTFKSDGRCGNWDMIHPWWLVGSNISPISLLANSRPCTPQGFVCRVPYTPPVILINKSHIKSGVGQKGILDMRQSRSRQKVSLKALFLENPIVCIYVHIRPCACKCQKRIIGEFRWGKSHLQRARHLRAQLWRGLRKRQHYLCASVSSWTSAPPPFLLSLLLSPDASFFRLPQWCGSQAVSLATSGMNYNSEMEGILVVWILRHSGYEKHLGPGKVVHAFNPRR